MWNFTGGKREKGDMLLFQRKFRRQAFPATRFNGRLEAAPNAELGMLARLRRAERGMNGNGPRPDPSSSVGMTCGGGLSSFRPKA